MIIALAHCTGGCPTEIATGTDMLSLNWEMTGLMLRGKWSLSVLERGKPVMVALGVRSGFYEWAKEFSRRLTLCLTRGLIGDSPGAQQHWSRGIQGPHVMSSLPPQSLLWQDGWMLISMPPTLKAQNNNIYYDSQFLWIWKGLCWGGGSGLGSLSWNCHHDIGWDQSHPKIWLGLENVLHSDSPTWLAGW